MDTKKFTLITDSDFDYEYFEDLVGELDGLLPTKSPLYKYYKKKKVLAMILRTAYRTGQLFMYADKEGNVAGLLMCHVDNLWWIDGNVLVEDLLISLSHRPTGFGSFAISELETIARISGCKIICTGSSMVKDSTPIRNMYKNSGFVVYGESYLKEVNSL